MVTNYIILYVLYKLYYILLLLYCYNLFYFRCFKMLILLKVIILVDTRLIDNNIMNLKLKM